MTSITSVTQVKSRYESYAIENNPVDPTR